MEKKVALIIGGTSGIGKHTALILAKQKVKIIIAGRNERLGNDLAEQIHRNGGEAVFIATNVTIERDIIDLVKTSLKAYGRIDFLFNNAGTEGVLGPLEINSEEIIDDVLGVNIKGVLLGIKHVLPVMHQQNAGVIVNTASFVGTTLALPIAVAYGASKSAVLSITQSVAASITKNTIKVYALCPWVTDTPMADRLTDHDVEAKKEFGANINPGGKIVSADDIAAVAVRLFQGTTALSNGEAILVDSENINRINAMSIGEHVTL